MIYFKNDMNCSQKNFTRDLTPLMNIFFIEFSNIFPQSWMYWKGIFPFTLCEIFPLVRTSRIKRRKLCWNWKLQISIFRLAKPKKNLTNTVKLARVRKVKFGSENFSSSLAPFDKTEYPTISRLLNVVCEPARLGDEYPEVSLSR